MRTTSASDLHRNLAAVLDRVSREREPVMVTRSRKPAAVLIALEDYEALTETMHLLGSPRNADRLLAAVNDLDERMGKNMAR